MDRGIDWRLRVVRLRVVWLLVLRLRVLRVLRVRVRLVRLRLRVVAQRRGAVILQRRDGEKGRRVGCVVDEVLLRGRCGNGGSRGKCGKCGSREKCWSRGKCGSREKCWSRGKCGRAEQGGKCNVRVVSKERQGRVVEEERVVNRGEDRRDRYDVAVAAVVGNM